MFDIEARIEETHVVVVCKGPASLTNLMDMIDKVKMGAFGSSSMRKYLIDLRPIQGTIGVLDRYKLGEYMAGHVANLKIAAISKTETYDKVGENVAVNRGATVFATDNEAKAVAWLTAGGDF